MALEIFGFAIKPEISIGDIAAIAALIASPLIFWFGYSRTRRSEQIRITRELMDKIHADALDEIRFRIRSPYPKGGSDEDKNNWIDEEMLRLNPLRNNISYFRHLVKIKDIKEKDVVDYYRSTIIGYLNMLDEFCSWAECEPKASERMKRYPRFHEQVRELMERWKEVK